MARGMGQRPELRHGLTTQSQGRVGCDLARSGFRECLRPFWTAPADELAELLDRLASNGHPLEIR